MLGSLPKLGLALGAPSYEQIERWRIGAEPTPDGVFLRAVDLLGELEEREHRIAPIGISKSW